LSLSSIHICESCHADSPGDALCCVRCGEELTDRTLRSGEDLEGLEIADKYRLVEAVGEGAMGWVYRAVHRSLKTDVAVKLMKPSGEDPDRQSRFEREARLASRLSHPHIIAVTDFGHTPGGMLYIVSEFIRGKLLTDTLNTDEPLPLGHSLNIFHQLLAAVEEAHSVGLVHRDIKPDNIMVTPLRSGEDFVKVLDFGIAQMVDVSEGSDSPRRRGDVCGTPAYMAPEQIRGETATPRSDLYSCGLILHEMLTSRSAYSSSDVMEVLAQQLHASPEPIRSAAPLMDYPEGLERVVERVLSKDANARYASASEFREALFGSVENLRQEQIACHACQDGPESTWSPYCNRCGFRPAYAGSFSAPTQIELEPPESPAGSLSDEPVSSVLPAERKAARATGASTAVTVQMPAMGEPEPRKTTGRLPVVPFLGREEALREVDRFLGASDTVLEVVGEPGSGKSTLLGQIACRVVGRSVRADVDPSLARAPWFPIRRVVAQVLELPSESPAVDVLRQHVVGAGLVPEDVPGLVDLFGVARTAEVATPEVRLSEIRAAAQRALLSSETARRGYCLVFDDVDAYDGASLRFVRSLAEAVVPSAVKIVLTTSRPVLPGDGAHASLYLGPLGPSSLEEMVHRASPDHRDPAGLARSLGSRSGGNPLHAQQALLLLAEGGGLIDGDLRDVVRSRITRLSPPGLRLLQTLCIAGDGAETHLLVKLFPDVVEFAQAIGELAAAGYATKEGGRLKMGSSTVASIVRDLTEPGAKQAIHRELHERLRAHGVGVIERVRHAAEAGLGEETLELLLEAGEVASFWLDEEAAAAHYRRGLDTARWELLMGEEDERLPFISLKLGDSLRRSGHYLAAEMTYKEALTSCARYPVLRARLQGGMAKLLVERGLWDEGLGVMQKALTQAHAADNADGGALMSEMYVSLSDLLHKLGRTDQAAEQLAEGIFLVTSGDGVHTTVPPDGFWRLLAHAAEVQHALGEVSQSAEFASMALHHAQRERSLLGQAQCNLLLARLGTDVEPTPDDHPDDSFEGHCASALAAFKRLGDRRSVAECLLLRASRHPDPQPVLVAQALALAQQIDWTEGVNEAMRLS
jgi:serine/threonine protein kinase/tetratricopeptide (TPR) repeat protein